jgi:hypothetical protein
MTTKHLMRRARELYNVDYVPPHINRANQRAWVRAVISLGTSSHQPGQQVAPEPADREVSMSDDYELKGKDYPDDEDAGIEAVVIVLVLLIFAVLAAIFQLTQR